jgi:hypothetical protein
MANRLNTNADSEENPEYIKNLVDNPIIVHGKIVINPSRLPKTVYQPP